MLSRRLGGLGGLHQAQEFVKDHGWGAPRLLNDDAGFQHVQDEYDQRRRVGLAFDPHGGGVAVWTRSVWARSSPPSVLWSRLDPLGGWREPQPLGQVDGETPVSWPVALATDPEGNAIAAWTQDPGPVQSLLSAHIPVGRRSSDPQAVVVSPDGVGYPWIGIDSRGTALLLWADDGLWGARFERR